MQLFMRHERAPREFPLPTCGQRIQWCEQYSECEEKSIVIWKKTVIPDCNRAQSRPETESRLEQISYQNLVFTHDERIDYSTSRANS